MITYNAELTGSDENKGLLMSLLEEYRIVVNKASKLQFENKLDSITTLHNAFYYKTRAEHPEIPSQVVIKAEQESLATYKSIRSNKHKIKEKFVKKGLSLRIDKRLYSKSEDKTTIFITTKEGRKEFSIKTYPRLIELLSKYEYADPFLFVKNSKIMIGLSFENAVETKKSAPLCLGVDLGIRRVAACSDGRLIIDRKFNADKRALRYLKRCLQGSGTKNAKKHLKKIRRKERNKNKNQTHLVANEILRTNANIIALENLKGIKAKKHKYQNKNAISQVPIFELRIILTYKAKNMGKHICLVSPMNTSKIDSVSGIKEGNRIGCRFYAKNGLVYDADINAAVNIARRSKHPISQGNLLDGQGIVNRPIACKSLLPLSA